MDWVIWNDYWGTFLGSPFPSPAKKCQEWIKHEKYDFYFKQCFFSSAFSFWASFPISLDCLGIDIAYGLDPKLLCWTFFYYMGIVPAPIQQHRRLDYFTSLFVIK